MRGRGKVVEPSSHGAALATAGAILTDLLPQEWRLERLENVVSASRNPRFRDPQPREATPFIPMSLIPNDARPTMRWEMRAPAEVRSGVPFAEGDVLLARITPCLENGKLAVACGIPGGWGMTSTEVLPLRPNSVTADFLAFFLAQPAVRAALASKMQGATGRQRLAREALDVLAIPVPPLAEQRAIAAALRTVQYTRDECEQAIAATRQLKQTLLHYLFTYGPVPFDQADHVPLRESEIGPVPEHWELKKLGEVCSLSTGATPPTNVPEYYGGTTPLIRTSQITNNRIRYSSTHVTEKAIRDCHLETYKPGTVLLAMYGQGKTRGQSALLETDAATTQNAAAIRPTSILDAEFLWMCLLGRYEALRGEGIQGHISHLNLGYVAGLAVPLPPLPEQLTIASHLSTLDAKLAAEEARRAALDNLFKSLLHHLMTGKVRVNHLIDQLTGQAPGQPAHQLTREEAS